MSAMPRTRVVLRAAVMACALLTVPASAETRAPVASVTVTRTQQAAYATPTDASLTARLRDVANESRRGYGRETFYARGTYLTSANRVTSALVQGQPAPRVPDGAPLSQLSGTSAPEWYEEQVNGGIDAVVYSARNVIAYPLHTDAGWSVRSVRLADGRIRWAVALVVGWPDPATTSNTGCASDGYCWSTRGLNPHLPWTRNTVTWYLSTSGLPSNGEALMKSAIATVNRVSGFGADVVYGGKTSSTTPNGTNRFLVVFGSGCASSSALGCTMAGTQGSYDLIYQAKVVVSRAKYDANPSTSLWTGTLVHEIAHGSGLSHYDGTYAGRYQLMRWAGGPNALQAGDLNGLRRMAPGGRVTASLRAVRHFGNADLVVLTTNSGLGGIRSITTQCLDANGAWQTIATVSGKFDGRGAERTVGNVSTLSGSRQCRAIVRSKTAAVTSATITVSG